jgi:hypothetical protein
MTLDHRFREAVDAFLNRVRRDIDAHVQGLSADLLRVASENQEYWRSTLERAVTDARQDAERGFKARLEALRNELTREMETRLSTERAQLQSATRAAAQAAAEAAEAASAANAAKAQHLLAKAQFNTQDSKETARDAASPRGREARLYTLERLLEAFRRIDDATSLTSILHALKQAVEAEASHVAILVVDNDVLRPFVTSGFSTGQIPESIAIGSSGVLAATVALKQTSYVKPLIARDLTTPSFMQVPVGHTGLVVPVIVGGDVVAVLYADDSGRDEEPVDSPVWAEEIDLLVRHAAIRLENLTSVRTAEVFD